MQNIFSLRNSVSPPLDIFNLHVQAVQRSCYFKRSSQLSQSLQTLSEKSGEEARRGVKLSSSSRNMDCKLLGCWVANFSDQFAKHFDHTDSSVQNPTVNVCLFFTKLKLKSWHETDQSGKAFIQTSVRKKQGVSFTKNQLIKLRIFNGLSSNWAQFWSHIKFPGDKRMSFEVTLSILSALSQFACLVWLSRLAPILTLQYSPLLIFRYFYIRTTHNGSREGGGSISDSVCPSSLGTDIYHKAPTFIFAWCLIPPDIYNTSDLIVYSGRALRGIGWEFAWLKGKILGLRQETRS